MDLDLKLRRKSLKQLTMLLNTLDELNEKCANQSAIETASTCIWRIGMLKEKSLKESKENGTYRIWFDNPD